MNTIAFFDVDNTLFDGYSGYHTTRILAQKKMVKTHHILVAIFYRILAPIYRGDVKRMYEVILGDLAGRTLDEVMAVGKECFENSMKPKLFREGVEAIAEHRRLGHKVYLLSSGPGMVIDHVADFLKVDGAKSVGPVVMGGVLQKKINDPICYQEGKLILAQQIAKKEFVDLSECYFYADSIDDISLMIRVGHPRPVNPDNSLKKMAVQKEWPIRHFRSYWAEGLA